ncbi:VanZ family protein [Clostridium sp. C8-1-8]|uniref:VanZ family protein n=1 Tax=Clostridium sp. C8-1-8 TaxID=2698831 RepID=UPI00136830C8|nr:VanZ family protein [Clostridium sp. C8-1-8]
MNGFRDYINDILKDILTDSSSKKDIADEIEDHLNMLKQEFISQGFSESEAVEMAIKNFGEIKKIKKNYANTYNTFSRTTSILAAILFTMYMLMFIQVSFLRYKGEVTFDTINLVPFKSIYFYLTNFNHINNSTWFSALFGPVIAFIPFGFLIPVIVNKIKNANSIALVSLAFAIFTEVLQHITKLGVADIDDVMSAIIGSLVGYALLKLMVKIILTIKKLVSNLKLA